MVENFKKESRFHMICGFFINWKVGICWVVFCYFVFNSVSTTSLTKFDLLLFSIFWMMTAAMVVVVLSSVTDFLETCFALLLLLLRQQPKRIYFPLLFSAVLCAFFRAKPITL